MESNDIACLITGIIVGVVVTATAFSSVISLFVGYVVLSQ